MLFQRLGSIAVKLTVPLVLCASISVARADEAAEGDLIKGTGAEVYLVVFNQKRHIANADVFVGCGLDWGKIKTLDDALVNDIPAVGQLTTANDCKSTLALAKAGPKDACEKVKFYGQAAARHHSEYRKTDATVWSHLKAPLKQKIVEAEAKKAEAQKGCNPPGDKCAPTIGSNAEAATVCGQTCSPLGLTFAGNWSCDNAAASACTSGSCVCGCK